MTDDYEALRDWMARPDVRAAVARRLAEPDEEEPANIPVNLTIDDMEWEAEMVFGYDGWDDDEGDGYPDEEEPLEPEQLVREGI